MSTVEISCDLGRIDFAATSALLKASYWGEGRTDAANRRGFEHSLCAAAYLDGKQVGFARVISDRAVFAYLLDVIVWPEHRGNGIGQLLIRALLDHQDLASVSNWALRTDDAHALYGRFGFKPLEDGRSMRLERHP